jgi:pentatricopeptide repeat protein
VAAGALEVFGEMRSKGVKPDVITYSACEKGGLWERALEVFDEMRSKGVKPDTITYSACEKGGQWPRGRWRCLTRCAARA